MPPDDEPPLHRAPSRVLIILLGSIGDVVRALPLLGRLRAAWPAAYLAWAVEPKSAPLLIGHPWLDQIITYDRRRAPWSFLPFLAQVRGGRFELVLDLQRHLKSGVISLSSGAPDRIGFARENVKEFNHKFSTRTIAAQPAMRSKLLQYQAFGDAVGAPPAPITFGLAPSAARSSRARELLESAARPRVAVNLNSSWPSRMLFPETIAAAIRALGAPSEHGPAFTPVLIGSPDDRDLANQVMHAIPDLPIVNLAGVTGLDELPAIFTECDAVFGPDCGPMHIAAAVGCPTVSLWGATAPARSAPWGFADFAISGEIPCSPCYLRQCPIGRECMRRIDPALITKAVRRA